MQRLHCAVENGDVLIVDLLLADGRIDVNAQNRHGSTALHLAAKAGHVGAVNRLLMANTIDINAQNRKGHSVLWNATRQGHGQIASRPLIGEDVEVNAIGTGESTERSTSLHHAVEERNLALVHQLLTKSTADPNVPDEDGRAPLWWAVEGATSFSSYIFWGIHEQNDIQKTRMDGRQWMLRSLGMTTIFSASCQTAAIIAPQLCLLRR